MGLANPPQRSGGHVTVSDWTADLLRPGDLVVAAQGVGEPTGLLEQLVRAGRTDVEVFVGLSHSRVLADPAAGALRLVSFGAMGPLAAHATAGTLSIIPGNFADLPRLLAHRAPGRLVVLVQVAAPDADGAHSLGTAVDYTYELLDAARAVVAEVNDQVPVTSAPRLPASAFTATLTSSRPLPALPTPTQGDAHRAIAGHVAGLVPDGATVQLGVGAVPSAIGRALTARRDLRVWSTLAGDWLLDLAKAGALRREHGSVVISEAAGSPALYAHVAGSDVLVRPVRELAAGLHDTFVALNAALQVDLTGQVNAEETGAGYVGGVGGQPDYLRAAQRSPGGLAVVALPATTGRGASRIVTRLAGGTVTTARSGVDVVVTEYGVADLRGRSLAERADALRAIAAPEHREMGSG